MGGLSITNETVQGGFEGARVLDKTSKIAAKGARVLGRIGNIFAAASIGYDFATGTANTSTLASAAVTVAGVAIITAVGVAAAPWVAIGGVVYGIAAVSGFDDWLNSNFDISGSINFVSPSSP